VPDESYLENSLAFGLQRRVLSAKFRFMEMLAIRVGCAPEEVAELSEEIGYDRPIAHAHCPHCHVSYALYGSARNGSADGFIRWSESKLTRECPDHPASFRTPSSLGASQIA
jgi:hypothetical protein